MRKKYVAIIISVVLVIIILVFSNIFLIKTVEVIFDKSPQITNEDEILTLANIKLNSNIFNLNEKEVIDSIANHFTDNTVAVTDIQRSFPNKVKLHIKERMPIMVVSYSAEDSQECIQTDIDFQLTQRTDKTNINTDIIYITGVYVHSTFNKPYFHHIREILYAYIDLDFNFYSLMAFIKEINIAENKIIIKPRNGECAFEVETQSETSISTQVKQLYHNYQELPYHNRDVFYLAI